jgi:two-component sensor histidine kinase/ABC-type amino acid transport substrate-binding protein
MSPDTRPFKILLLLLIFTGIAFNAWPDSIRLASEPDYPPFCMVGDDGQAVGFSIDLFKATAAVMKMDLKIKIDAWNIIKEELAAGEIDALPMVGRSPEREGIYDFTFPYYTLHGAIFVRQGTTTISSLEDLRNKELIVMRGDNAEEYTKRAALSTTIISALTYEEAFRLLQSGNHDAVIAQKLMGIQLLRRLGIESIVPLDIELTGFEQDFSFAVREGNKELLAKLNEGLSIIIANGTYDDIHKQWFKPIITTHLSVGEIIKRLLPVLIPFVILAFFIATIYLRFEVLRKTKYLKEEITERVRSEQKVARQLKDKEILLKEVHHRIKNNFATVESLLSLQALSLKNSEAHAALKDTIARVRSMRIIYEKLLLTDDYRETSTKQYMENLIDDIIRLFTVERKIELVKCIADVNLPPNILFSLGIIINELLTNIMKYAFTTQENCRIELCFTLDSESASIVVEDNGVGIAEDFSLEDDSGFGHQLVVMLAQQYDGDFSIVNTSHGTRSTVSFPRAAIVESPHLG